MKNNYNKIYRNNVVTIYDCFMYNQKAEFFTGNNKNYCNICMQKRDSNFISKIFVSPNILIVVLDKAFNVKLDIKEIIDITQYVILKDKPKLLYDLYGVISHIGKDSNNSYFVASCKSPVNNKWYRYNDALVNPINNLHNNYIN
jgi:ubiquitin C-terminal hydrolase